MIRIGQMVLPLFLLLSIHAFAADPVPTPPRFLYNWISYENLARRAAESLVGELNFGPPRKTTKFSNQNLLENLPTYYLWSHPIGGMGTQAIADYARFEMYGNSEALIKFEIDPAKAKVAKVTTTSEVWKPYSGDTDVDLIYHEHFDERGRLSFREWVLVNDRPVVGFTANPDQLRAEMEEDLGRLRDKGYQFPPETMHYPFFLNKERGELIKRVSDYLARGDENIPAFFRRPLSMRYVAGSHRFHHVPINALSSWHEPTRAGAVQALLTDKKVTPSEIAKLAEGLNPTLRLSALEWLLIKKQATPEHELDYLSRVRGAGPITPDRFRSILERHGPFSERAMPAFFDLLTNMDIHHPVQKFGDITQDFIIRTQGMNPTLSALLVKPKINPKDTFGRLRRLAVLDHFGLLTDEGKDLFHYADSADNFGRERFQAMVEERVGNPALRLEIFAAAKITPMDCIPNELLGLAVPPKN